VIFLLDVKTEDEARALMGVGMIGLWIYVAASK
jgi:hypothetical protein